MNASETMPEGGTMERSPLLDDTYFPLVRGVYFRSPTVEDLDIVDDYFGGILSRCRPFVSINDLRDVTMVDAQARKRSAEIATKHREAEGKYAMGSVIVVRSVLIRGVWTAIRWLAPPASPEYRASSCVSGAEKVREIFEQSGLELTPEILAQLEVISGSDPR